MLQTSLGLLIPHQRGKTTVLIMIEFGHVRPLCGTLAEIGANLMVEERTRQGMVPAPLLSKVPQDDRPVIWFYVMVTVCKPPGDAPRLQQLINLGADANAHNEVGETILMICAREGTCAVLLPCLLPAGVDLFFTHVRLDCLPRT